MNQRKRKKKEQKYLEKCREQRMSKYTATLKDFLEYMKPYREDVSISETDYYKAVDKFCYDNNIPSMLQFVADFWDELR